MKTIRERDTRVKAVAWCVKQVADDRVPPQLVRAANTLLREKVLFGSDYPVITPDRWLTDFAALDIKPAVRPKILKENAARLLGLNKEDAS